MSDPVTTFTAEHNAALAEFAQKIGMPAADAQVVFGAPGTLGEAAKAKLAALKADKDWGRRVLSGDHVANAQMKWLQTAILYQDKQDAQAKVQQMKADAAARQAPGSK